MAVILAKHIQSHVVIQSFDIRTLQYLHQRYPYMATSLLVGDRTMTLDARIGRLGFVPSIFSPADNLVSNTLISFCHGKHMKVVPWTVNDTAQMRSLRQMGVDGLISDYPDYYQQVFTR